MHGREYFFVSEAEFIRMSEQGEFIEWAHVHGRRYGTSRQNIETQLQAGCDVLLEIDWQGALQVKRQFPQATLMFVLPPGWDELRARLERRGEDAPEVIEMRLQNAREELAQAEKFDFVIINDIFDNALREMQTIVNAQRLRYPARRLARASIFEALGI